MDTKPFDLSIIQLPDETVERSGFRYVVVASGDGLYRPKGAAYTSLYQMTRSWSLFSETDWEGIEAALAKDKVWKEAASTDENLFRAIMNM